MLLAHAKAWHTYDKEFRSTQQGRVSIVVNAQWFEPKTDKEEDIKAADRGMQWYLGWMAHPVFVNGDYPEVMKTRIMEKSRARGLSSRFVYGIYRNILFSGRSRPVYKVGARKIIPARRAKSIFAHKGRGGPPHCYYQRGEITF